MASIKGHTGAENTDSDSRAKTHHKEHADSSSNSLLWFNGTLAGQDIPLLLDSGATTCCIAQRCVEGSPSLRTLAREPYQGPGLLSANGQLLQPSYVIKAPLVIGTPAISLTASFVVIKYLPYSCIIGLNLLNKLREWSINNELNVLKFNDSYLPVSCDPPHFNDINLILLRKQQLPPNQKVSVTTTARGLGLSAFRPVTIIPVLVEGNQHLENCLGGSNSSIFTPS